MIHGLFINRGELSNFIGIENWLSWQNKKCNRTCHLFNIIFLLNNQLQRLFVVSHATCQQKREKWIPTYLITIWRQNKNTRSSLYQLKITYWAEIPSLAPDASVHIHLKPTEDNTGSESDAGFYEIIRRRKRTQIVGVFVVLLLKCPESYASADIWDGDRPIIPRFDLGKTLV